MKIRAKDMTTIAVMTALICVVSPWAIPLPISAVSITFGSLAVLLTACLLGAKKGTAAIALYILIGFAGLPVFSNFQAGISILSGPTGGYIIGYIFMGIIAGLFAERSNGKISLIVSGMILGTLVLYIFGTAWLAYSANLGFTAALMAGVIPFIPGDIFKIIAVTVLYKALKPKLSFI